MQIEFEFTLPKGYLDAQGNVHRRGIMRLSTAMDEIVPLRDPRVRANPAYATVIILARVITHLGALDEITPATIEGLFACDLNFLQQFYRYINELEEDLLDDQHDDDTEYPLQASDSAHEPVTAIA
ncbi:MAG: hypothetical protein AAFQ57_10600 [Cyanobacteria bacterium J06626_14]